MKTDHLNFSHLEDDQYIDAIQVIKKIEHYMSMLNKITGQAFTIAPEEQPTPKRAAEKETSK